MKDQNEFNISARARIEFKPLTNEGAQAKGEIPKSLILAYKFKEVGAAALIMLIDMLQMDPSDKQSLRIYTSAPSWEPQP